MRTQLDTPNLKGIEQQPHFKRWSQCIANSIWIWELHCLNTFETTKIQSGLCIAGP